MCGIGSDCRATGPSRPNTRASILERRLFVRWGETRRRWLLLARDAARHEGHCQRHHEDARHMMRAHVNRVEVQCERSEEHTSELQSLAYIVCCLLLPD